MEETLSCYEAIRRYLAGDHPAEICRALGYSKPWLYKWLKRYDPVNPAWAQSRSHAPHHLTAKTPQAVECLVCEIRQRLVQTRYAQRGAFAIQWQLQQLGVQALPEIWTINRILHRHGLAGQRRYQPRGTPYPALAAQLPHQVHQLDLVGPRYLTGGERFYGLHLIDVYSHAVALAAVPSKQATDVVEALVAGWQKLGRPRYLQVDNELSFRGSNRHPRSFGLLIRLYLYLGVEVVFIPEREPWRNGVIERFNQVYNQLFWQSQSFRDLAHLAAELPGFEAFHNTQHLYATLEHRTPWQVHSAHRRRRLSSRFTLHRQDLPSREGRVSFMRLTDAQGYVRFFSESFLVDAALVHEYIKGTITTRSEQLAFFHQGRRIKRYPYTVTKPQCARQRCPATKNLLNTVNDVLLYDSTFA
jgi:putative transposase